MSNLENAKFTIHYHKINPINLECLEETYENNSTDHLDNDYNPFKITKLQNYNPIYNDFFALNDKNFNQITLNSKYHIKNLNSVYDVETKETIEKPVFIKFGPLLDPIRYMIGKYDIKDDKIRTMPTITTTTDDCIPKLLDKNNSAYVDSFFSFLSSILLNNHNFVHGLDYFGSFLGVQEKFRMNIADDLDYLKSSTFFNHNLGNYFSTPINIQTDYNNFGSRGNKNKLNISNTQNKLNISCISLCDNEVTDLNENIENAYNIDNNDNNDNKNNFETVYEKELNNETKSSSSSSSSNSSNNSEANYSTDDDDSDSDNTEDDSNDDTTGDDDDSTDDSTDDNTNDEDSETTETEYSEDTQLFSYINDFPIQMICLEKCDGTLDELFENDLITHEIGTSAMMQIIMTLLTYQKVFHFTHNDLHTNNIMYMRTTKEFLYYKFNNKIYKVPTFGKIFKIIDFGRAIYKFQGNQYCSDSFAPGGDGHTQYNCEPYMNENKPRLDPNYSFDLCRLGTSIYDFIIDIDDKEDDLDFFQKTILRWCKDDNGKNVLYKKNGDERYPNFKLYKMIARTVHNHTPQEQLNNELFKMYELSKHEIENIANSTEYNDTMDIDTLPVYALPI
jgi:hypothetical protein